MEAMDNKTLLALAADRPVQGGELHEVNSYYGHAAIIKGFLGLHPDYPLKVMLEHAPSVQEFIWEVEEFSPLPYYLCASERYAAYFNAGNRGGKTAIPIGPYLAYMGLAPAPRREPGRRTLLLFPKHSTHHIVADYDAEDYLRRIEDVTGAFDRVVACMYWKDILMGRHRPYRNAGFDLVTAGHMFDDRFLPRLAEIIRDADMVVSGYPGTDVNYAVLLGKPVLILPSGGGFVCADKRIAREFEGIRSAPDEMRDTYPLIFNEPLDALRPDQEELVGRLCGTHNVRTRQELMDVVVAAEARFCKMHKLPFRGVPLAEQASASSGLAV